MLLGEFPLCQMAQYLKIIWPSGHTEFHPPAHVLLPLLDVVIRLDEEVLLEVAADGVVVVPAFVVRQREQDRLGNVEVARVLSRRNL